MAEERVIKIGMLGLGTVGTGVYKVLKSQQEEMLPKLGARVELKKILVRNVEKAAAKVDDPSIITTNFEDIANDPEIEIVVEVMGGKQPAMNYILACLDAGKNVVTANKDLVASEGKKILAAAKRNGKDFLYEASVAGGIPIIRPVKQCLAANHITELMGIFNGTTNFVSTQHDEFITAKGITQEEADLAMQKKTRPQMWKVLMLAGKWQFLLLQRSIPE